MILHKMEFTLFYFPATLANPSRIPQNHLKFMLAHYHKTQKFQTKIIISPYHSFLRNHLSLIM